MSGRRALCFSILLAGCSKDPIQVYRIPKEEAVSVRPMAAASPSPATRSDLSWTVPSSWREQPATQMRKASFSAGSADVSVVVFPGDSGGALANVNRWRGQVGLEPIDEAGLAGASSRLKAPAGELLVVDFEGKEGKRTVAAILASGGRTWFFKLSGDGSAVSPQKESFLSFLRSLHG